MTTTSTFSDVITSAEELRDIIGTPRPLAVSKQIAALDEHCRRFIAHSPFLLLATSNAAGTCDVSPRGDAPGFVLVHDDNTLVIPERPGNKRTDSLKNILENPNAGLIFIIPGIEETLRVNGRASIIRDEALLESMAVEGRRPLVGIGIEVEEAMLHCPKAFKRARLWDTSRWTPRSALPSFGKMLIDQTKLEDCPVEVLDNLLEEANKRLY